MRKLLSGLVLALTFAWMADASEWKIDVRNSGHERGDLIVSHEVNQQWVELLKEHTLVELLEDGKTEPVPCVIDRTGDHPVLAWLLGGTTAPYQKRSFVLAAKGPFAVLGGGLKVARRDGQIEIENADYKLRQPLKGGGGFPRNIRYACSGFRDDALYFLDRIVCEKPAGGIQQFAAQDCEGATTRVLFSSPLRVVIETTTGFGRDGGEVADRPQVIYRYTHTAFSPVIDVAASYRRGDNRVWREVHFMHLSRKERGPYTEVITGAPLKKTALLEKGKKSAAVHGANWAVLSDGVNGCGVGYGDVIFWDASDEFVYYLRGANCSWESGSLRFKSGLYLGSGTDDADYDAWMGAARQPEITFTLGDKPVLPIDQQPVAGEHVLQDSDIKIAFDSAEQGFDCLGIENSVAKEARFVSSQDGLPGFWRLTFKGAADTNGVRKSVVIDNHAPAQNCVVKKRKRELTFTWRGIDLPDEPASVDVIARVKLDQAAGESQWRIDVKNRSEIYGLWTSDYPVLRSVAKPGHSVLVAPSGNWGGSLYKQFNRSLNLHYPSARCPVQCMAYQQGSAGLYIGAHDGAARAKSLVINTSQDVTWRHAAANAGVAGAAGAPEYPIVIAAYNGSWWTMARRYRQWALKQRWSSKGALKQRADYPRNLRDLSFWMITSGDAASVRKTMGRAAELFPRLTIGTHWYNWHVIPFDHTYPEYFPAKPGVSTATKAMVSGGQVIMPYINARLWDRDIDSFKEARRAACKQPSGEIYIERYGSKRNLVPMCPHTKLWQDCVARICERLVNEVGVSAIYLDQIGAARPKLCYDSSHGHPLGGGQHWVDGYRAMLTPIKKFCVERGVALTTENTAEPYMDNIDAYLTWNPRYETDIPLLPAVYSGYTIYFSSPQSASDTLDAFCAAQGRDFLWGCQLGWNSGWILEDKHRKKQRFQYELCRYRSVGRDFFLYGQLLDDLKFENEAPYLSHTWHRTSTHSASLPAVMGTIWRAADGRNAVFLVNTSGEARKVSFDLSKQRQLKVSEKWKLRQLTPQGVKPVLETEGNLEIELAPHSVRGYTIGP